MTQSDTRSQDKRRIYYIEKEFQFKFIIKFCLLLALGSLLTVVLVYWLARHSTTVAIAQGHVAVHTTAEYLLPLMVQTVLIELIVVSLATIVMTLLISHKIAGPLYRLKVMLDGLAEGDLATHMHLRKGDQLKSVADTYNEVIHKLNYKVKMLKDASSMEDVKKQLDKFKTS